MKKGENLVKRGRPKTIEKAQNRTTSIVLTKEAYLLFRKIKSHSDYGGKWIHKFVSEKLIERFNKHWDEEILVEEINLLQDERQQIINNYDELVCNRVKKLNKLREKNRGETANILFDKFKNEVKNGQTN